MLSCSLFLSFHACLKPSGSPACFLRVQNLLLLEGKLLTLARAVRSAETFEAGFSCSSFHVPQSRGLLPFKSLGRFGADVRGRNTNYLLLQGGLILQGWKATALTPAAPFFTILLIATCSLYFVTCTWIFQLVSFSDCCWLSVKWCLLLTGLLASISKMKQRSQDILEHFLPVPLFVTLGLKVHRWDVKIHRLAFTIFSISPIHLSGARLIFFRKIKHSLLYISQFSCPCVFHCQVESSTGERDEMTLQWVYFLNACLLKLSLWIITLRYFAPPSYTSLYLVSVLCRYFIKPRASWGSCVLGSVGQGQVGVQLMPSGFTCPCSFVTCSHCTSPLQESVPVPNT